MIDATLIKGLYCYDMHVRWVLCITVLFTRLITQFKLAYLPAFLYNGPEINVLRNETAIGSLV